MLSTEEAVGLTAMLPTFSVQQDGRVQRDFVFASNDATVRLRLSMQHARAAVQSGLESLYSSDASGEASVSRVSYEETGARFIYWRVSMRVPLQVAEDHKQMEALGAALMDHLLKIVTKIESISSINTWSFIGWHCPPAKI